MPVENVSPEAAYVTKDNIVHPDPRAAQTVAALGRVALADANPALVSTEGDLENPDFPTAQDRADNQEVVVREYDDDNPVVPVDATDAAVLAARGADIDPEEVYRPPVNEPQPNEAPEDLAEVEPGEDAVEDAPSTVDPADVQPEDEDSPQSDESV